MAKRSKREASSTARSSRVGDSFRQARIPVSRRRIPSCSSCSAGAILVERPARARRRPEPGSVLLDLQIALWLWFTPALRELRRGDGRRARQGAGGSRCGAGAPRRWRAGSTTKREETGPARRRCARATASSSRPEQLDPRRRRRSSRESLRWTSRRSPASRRPVIRGVGGDRSAVTGGTRVLSRPHRRRITSNPGETFLDRMIALVEGASRQKTPNEIALRSCSSA